MMASMVYTAQEMREMADAVHDVSVNHNGEFYYEKYDKFNPDLVRDMLRQAAAAMEKSLEQHDKDRRGGGADMRRDWRDVGERNS